MVILFISGAEILVVLFFILIFFGAKSIPDIARTLGKGMREFNRATQEIRKEFDSATSDIKRDFKEVKRSVENDLNQEPKSDPT